MQNNWEPPTICPRISSGLRNTKGRWVNHEWADVKNYSELDLWRMCFPTDFLRDIVIPKINSNIRQSKTPVNMSEFVKWLGCIHFMLCFDGVEDRQDWWSTKDIDDYEGAPFRLNEHMS